MNQWKIIGAAWHITTRLNGELVRLWYVPVRHYLTGRETYLKAPTPVAVKAEIDFKLKEMGA